jgi:hypothetical protein
MERWLGGWWLRVEVFQHGVGIRDVSRIRDGIGEVGESGLQRVLRGVWGMEPILSFGQIRS